jgi:replicative DNA helicase
MQLIVDGLRLNPELRAVVCNIEMPAAVLLDRQLTRLSGISAETIRYRRLDASHGARLKTGMSTLQSIADRLCFLRPPLDLTNVAATADEFGGRLLLLDYIQRILPPGQHSDRRGSVDATMNYLRQFADAGIAVVVVAAVARQKDSRGRSSYGADALTGAWPK